jgi:MFS family permease
MNSMTPDPSEERGEGGGPYKVGTLSYTFPGLLLMMLWLLWGDFCFSVMQAAFPAVAPLMLGKLDAPNWMIALFLSTIPGILNATVCPFVSYWSDRYRSPLGRRIPFILYTIPFLCLFLVLIGAAPYLAAWLNRMGWLTDVRVTTLAFMGVFIIGFQFFNMFVGSVYYYLFNDVVPHEFLGRFLSIFRVVGVVATSGFYLFVFPKAETHFFSIFVGAAVLYGVVFLLMCRFVKEGRYPLPPRPAEGMSIFGGVITFFKESFSLRFYWLFYLSVAFWATAGASDVFLLFFSRSVGLSLEQFGLYTGIGAGVSAVFLIPCGILSDKFHSLRTMLVASWLAAACSALPLVFLLFDIPQEMGFAVWSMAFGVSLPVMALFTASELPTYMSILPKQRFGQFCAATALLRSVFAIFAGLICGLLIDWLKEINPSRAYLYLPIWPVVFQTLSAICVGLLYIEWKKLGGDRSYVPPLVSSDLDCHAHERAI